MASLLYCIFYDGVAIAGAVILMIALVKVILLNGDKSASKAAGVVMLIFCGVLLLLMVLLVSVWPSKHGTWSI